MRIIKTKLVMFYTQFFASSRAYSAATKHVVVAASIFVHYFHQRIFVLFLHDHSVLRPNCTN